MRSVSDIQSLVSRIKNGGKDAPRTSVGGKATRIPVATAPAPKTGATPKRNSGSTRVNIPATAPVPAMAQKPAAGTVAIPSTGSRATVRDALPESPALSLWWVLVLVVAVGAYAMTSGDNWE